MFDRNVLINLDKRRDRLGAFKAKVESLPSLRDNYHRVRAIHGDSVGVPGFFTSGGGAWGCRQSHLRVIEDALLDGVDTLFVMEDDICFCGDFEEKLARFIAKVPTDWHGLMLGGQDHGTGSNDIGIEGVRQSRNTQRTHAYVVRGKEPLQDLYRLWARCDRHIDHVFGQWQTKWNVYQPDPFLCGQDETVSDISGRMDTVRYWQSTPPTDLKHTPLVLLTSPRSVAERLRTLGLHYGFDRDPVTGKDRGMMMHVASLLPADGLQKWANVIVAEAADRGDVPGVWHPPEVTKAVLAARLGGEREVIGVTAETVEEAVSQLPALQRAWGDSKIVWCWRGSGHELLEGLKYHGFHRGNWIDEVTGLDNGVRDAAEKPDNYGKLRGVVAQLKREIPAIRKGKVLVAHPQLDMAAVRSVLPEETVIELTGNTAGEIIQCTNESHAAQRTL